MAKGMSFGETEGSDLQDLEKFVLCSSPRAGLKREFAWAVRIHSEFSGSLGRTRARKFWDSPSVSQISPRVEAVEQFSAADAVAENGDTKIHGNSGNFSVDVKSSPEEASAIKGGSDCSEEKRETPGSIRPVEAGSSELEKVVLIDGVNSGDDVQILDFNDSFLFAPPSRRITRSISKNNVLSISVSSPVVKHEPCLEDDPILSTESSDHKRNIAASEPINVFKRKRPSTNQGGDMGSELPELLKQNSLSNGLSRESSLANSIVSRLRSNGFGRVPVQSIDEDLDPGQTGIKGDGSGSLSKMATDIDSSPSEDAFQSKVRDNIAAGTTGSATMIDIPAGPSTDMDIQLSRAATPNKKLELKMSKKISLTKSPCNINDLLATGMLEGFPVRYVFRRNKQGLQGTIKGGGILCACPSCKGCKVVNSVEFERHAGSANKHAAAHMYLENGKSIRDILRECRSAPLATLEATIQTAIGSSPDKNPSCQTCKGEENTCIANLGAIKNLLYCSCKFGRESFRASSHGTAILLCSKCRSSKQSQLSHPDEVQASLGLQQPSPKGRPLATDSCSMMTKKTTHGNEAAENLQKCAPKGRPPATDSRSTKKTTHGNEAAKKLSKPVLVLESSNSTPKDVVRQKKTDRAKLTRKDLTLHKLVFMRNGLPDGTELAYYARGQRLLEGYKQGNGIFCRCCNSEVSPSQFEAHAGWATRRKPYDFIYTSNGVSLHELSISLSKGRKFSASDNDDLCSTCGDGGDLLLCDGCPRAFHKECLELSCTPPGDWYCPYCQYNFEKDRNAAQSRDALAAGRVSGVDPIEMISKRLIRVVEIPVTDAGGCVLCRGHDFCKSKFGPRTVILCDQCEKEFHVGCLKEHEMGDLKELPKGKWFCSADCSRIHGALQKLLVCGAEKLPDSLLGVIKKKNEGKDLSDEADPDVRWQLLSGKVASPPDSRLILAKAVTIFRDCFDPIVESATGRDLIPSMVYGRSTGGQEFGGMYCAVLTVNSSVVSAGILRIFGKEVAELPLVATHSEKQGLGYFQSLFTCIERLLGFLNVKHLVLPAADEAESIWTRKFGFTKISKDQLNKYTTENQMMTFQGTSMLHKSVPRCRIVGVSNKVR